MKNMMNRHFWTGQNSKLLLFALAPIPIIAGGVFFLMDRIDAKGSDSHEPHEPHVAVTETAVVKPEVAAVETADEISEAEVEQDSEDTSSPEAEAEETMLSRFLERLDQVAETSNLYEAKEELRSGLEKAEAIELISTTVFESGQRSLTEEQISELESLLDDNAAIEKYGSSSNATLVVLGYADQVGNESTNNSYARSRAQSLGEAVEESSQIEDSDLVIKTWYVGETDLLTKEQGSDEEKLNRAAEVWLIVQDEDLFDEVGSDTVSSAATCDSDNSSSTSGYGNSKVPDHRAGNSRYPSRGSRHEPKTNRSKCDNNQRRYR
jgi:outer membrane protein OmpA-like peptidoglycan-associated protein